MELEVLKAIAGLGIGAVFGMVVFFMYVKAVKEHRGELLRIIEEKQDLHRQDIACQKEVALALQEVTLTLKGITVLLQSMNTKSP